MRVVDDRMPAEDDVAEQVPSQVPYRRHDPAHAQQSPEFFGVPGRVWPGPDDFLQGDQIGIDRSNHVGDSSGQGAAIQATAPMDVVRGDAKRAPAGISHAVGGWWLVVSG